MYYCCIECNISWSESLFMALVEMKPTFCHGSHGWEGDEEAKYCRNTVFYQESSSVGKQHIPSILYVWKCRKTQFFHEVCNEGGGGGGVCKIFPENLWMGDYSFLHEKKGEAKSYGVFPSSEEWGSPIKQTLSLNIIAVVIIVKNHHQILVPWTPSVAISVIAVSW